MSQHRRLFALLFAVTTPLVVLASFLVVISVRESKELARQDATALAQAGTLATDFFFEGHTRTLRAIALGLGDAPELSELELRTRLSEFSTTSPEWDGMSVVRADGIVLAGMRATSAGADLSERRYLKELFATDRPVVSEGIVSIEGDPSVIVGTPLRFDDGTIGALLGQVKLGTLSKVLTESLTADARVGLIDSAGQTLVHPDRARVAGLLNVADRPEVISAWEGETRTVEVERGGTDLLVASAPVSRLGWVVTVAEDAAAAYAEANAIAMRGIIFIALAASAVFVGGWFLGGKLNRSYEAMHEAQLAEAFARERAEAALRSREEFISIASHELRNPVAAIRGFGQLMQRRLARGTLTDDDLSDYVDNVATSGAYLSRLVDDLLSVSRLEGGRLELVRENVDVMAILRRAAAEAPLAGHPLRVNPPAEPIIASIDPDRVTQILVNLLENAAKYSPEGAEILVEVGLGGGELHVAVTDQGIGLREEDLARLFAPFARAANARDANIPGLGLGLYVSRRLAEAHGGSLLAASAGEGLGSTFTLVLPLSVGRQSGELEAQKMQPADEPGTPIEAVERSPA